LLAHLGNGLTAVNTYDSLGRNSGGWVCAGSSQPTCTGGTLQAYGYTVQTVGTQVKQTCDIVLNVCNSFGYDEFNRLTARTVNQGTVQNFTYTYDRYGNRCGVSGRSFGVSGVSEEFQDEIIPDVCDGPAGSK
jgi:YD repeat-containing protein